MSADLTPNPKLRLIDAQPLKYEGEAYLMLRDPLQLTDKSLLVPQPLIPILALCDGTHSLAGIRGALALRRGFLLSTERIRSFVDMLDDACLLENERSLHARVEAQREFRQAAFRPPASAGISYPADPVQLSEVLNQFLLRAKNQTDPETSSATQPAQANGKSRLCGIVSPHIDFERGGLIYAQTWGHAAQAVQQADLAIIFGTDHFSEGQPISLTRQSYATPYGVLPTHVEIVNALAQAIGHETAFAGELHHRREHSIELAATWLHHMRDGKPILVVPILTGSMDAQHSRGNGHEFQAVLDVLGSRIHNQRTLVIAAGDLAHVGPAFDGEPVNPDKLASLTEADDELIDAMCRGDAEGFHGAIQRVQDANNVCGVTPIYLTLRLLAPQHGENLGYAVCPADEAQTSVVTICGVSLYSADESSSN